MSRPLARMTSMLLQPAAIELAFDHFRDASAPLVRAQAGSLGILGAGNRESGFSCAVSFWETRESLERSNAEPRVVEAMGGYAKWMAGPFRVESYTVASGTVPEPDPASTLPTWLRTTTVQPTAEQLTNVLAIYEERLASARSSSPACIGVILLSPQIGSRIIAIEQWSSMSTLNAWNANATIDDQRLFRAGYVDEPPVRDTLEVFGHY